MPDVSVGTPSDDFAFPMFDTEQLDAIDRDRRKRENELLLALLLIGGQAYRTARHDVKLGSDPLYAIRLVLTGNQHFPGMVAPIAKAMVEAHQAGFARMMRMTGGTVEEPIPVYTPAAQNAASLAIGTLVRQVNGALSAPVAPESTLDALKQAWRDAGWTARDPRTLRALTGSVIVQGYGGGMFRAGQAIVKVRGFVHRSVLDDGTTEICVQRDGLRLPKDHAYWRSNFPPLHFGCRSVLMPVLSDGPWSDWLPTVPPAPGWGRMAVLMEAA